MSNKHKDWLVQEQTALGKDFSNPLMADNLPKIVWLSTHHIWLYRSRTKDLQKPSRKQSTGVKIRDTTGLSVLKKKAPATTNKSKGIDLLSEVALLEDAQMKKVLKQSKRETHSQQACGSSDGVGSQPKVLDKLQDKAIGTNEGTESGDDDDSNEDDSNDDDFSDDDGNDDDSDDDGSDYNSDDERTESDEDKNPNLNQKDDDHEEEYVHTPENYEFTDDENEHLNEEEYGCIDEELYKDVNTTYDQVEDDANVILATVHDTQKTEVPLQSSSVSYDFATQFLNLDNVSPADTEIISMMNIDVRHEEPSIQTPSLLTIPVMVIPETSTATATTIPSTIPPFTPLPHQSTLTPTPTTKATTSLPVIPDFSSLFGFNQRVSVLEKELSQLKQFDHSAQLLEAIKSQVPAVVEAYLGTRLGDYIQKAFQSYTAEFEKKAQAKKKRYINIIEKSVKDIINDEVKTQLPQILPKKVADFVTPMIQSIITESLENLDKDLFESYGKAYSLKIDREDKDKDEDPPARSDQRLKRRNTSKDAKESVFEATDTRMPKNQGSDLGNTGDQPDVKAAPKHDWIKEPERPLTPNSDWNVGKYVDFIPPQTWISKIAQLEKPPLSFDKLMIVTDRLDWNNLEGKEYLFDLSNPIPLIIDRGCQVVPIDYFINNDIEVLNDNDSMDSQATGCSNMKWYDYGYWRRLKFEENIIQKKLSNNERDVIFDLGVALRMSDISNRTPYTAYNNPQGIIYEDKYKRNKLMRTDELYMFSDGTLTSVRFVLHDIATNMRMDYLPKRRWSSLNRKRSRIMIKAINKQLLERRLMRSLEKFVEITGKTSDYLNGQYEVVIFCPTPF
ncbi:hypothetical protein Tco_1533664 [Tanacetum coccineum]